MRNGTCSCAPREAQRVHGTLRGSDPLRSTGQTAGPAPAKLLSQGCSNCWPKAAHTAGPGLSELVSHSVSQWPWGCTRSTACHQPSLTPTCFWIKIHPSLSFYLRTLAVYLTKKASMFHYFFPFFKFVWWSWSFPLLSALLNDSYSPHRLSYNLKCIYTPLLKNGKRILCELCVKPKCNATEKELQKY